MASNLIAHVEIPSTNLDKTTEFLDKVFGWKFKPFGKGYLLFNTHQGFTIGIRQAEKIIAGDSTIFHVRVNDINKYLSSASEAGGKILRGKTTIPAMGFYALITDPDGNVVGLFQGNE